MNARIVPPIIRRPRLGRSAAVVTMLTAATSCYSAASGDPEFWAPLPGAGGAGSAAGSTSGSYASSASASSSASGSQTTSSTGTGPLPTGMPRLTIDFTTVSFGGQYAPKNVGAVWITDGQDGFVKTLERWAVKRSKYLVKWKAASGGNVVDAVSGATRAQHAAHSLEWDGTDVNGAPVADGIYRVYVEFTEKNGAGPWTSIEFTKGSSPVTITPGDLAAFTGQHISYTP